MTVSVILDPATGAIVLTLMLFFCPSIASVLAIPNAPNLAEIKDQIFYSSRRTEFFSSCLLFKFLMMLIYHICNLLSMVLSILIHYLNRNKQRTIKNEGLFWVQNFIQNIIKYHLNCRKSLLFQKLL